MFQPILAFATPEIIIGIVVIGAILFGAEKLPKLARSAGQAKKEFMMGQIEADEAAAKAREDAAARARAASDAAAPAEKSDAPTA
jgi:sec-independent protein translocase protein TatA